MDAAAAVVACSFFLADIAVLVCIYARLFLLFHGLCFVSLLVCSCMKAAKL